MRTIELSKEQREKVINALAAVHDENGRFDIDIELDDALTLNAKGWLELDGYLEDDYYNGTGAYIATHRSASVTLTAYNEEGEQIGLDSESYNIIHKYLNAA